MHNIYEDAINDLTTLLDERTKNRPTNPTVEDINGGIWYALKHLQHLMGELAKQAIRDGVVNLDGMIFTHYATFECTDPTGHITNYMKLVGE